MIGVVEINEVSLTFQFGKWDALNANQSILLRSSEINKKLGKKTFDNGILCDKLSDVENSISILDFFKCITYPSILGRVFTTRNTQMLQNAMAQFIRSTKVSIHNISLLKGFSLANPHSH